MRSPPAFPLVSIYKQNEAAAKKQGACKPAGNLFPSSSLLISSRLRTHKLSTFNFQLSTFNCQLSTNLRQESLPLSRKEVFQPHLPVRLPCYDLAPITCIALGRAFWLRTSGAPGFHGLTGGVYKARERIHRAMADARLLANPASRSRVADSGPNWEGIS